MSGLMADARTLVEQARMDCQNHKFTYNEVMSTESCAKSICEYVSSPFCALSLTSFSSCSFALLIRYALRFGDEGAPMSRPFGVALLIAGDHLKFHTRSFRSFNAPQRQQAHSA